MDPSHIQAIAFGSGPEVNTILQTQNALFMKSKLGPAPEKECWTPESRPPSSAVDDVPEIKTRSVGRFSAASTNLLAGLMKSKEKIGDLISWPVLLHPAGASARSLFRSGSGVSKMSLDSDPTYTYKKRDTNRGVWRSVGVFVAGFVLGMFFATGLMIAAWPMDAYNVASGGAWINCSNSSGHEHEHAQYYTHDHHPHVHGHDHGNKEHGHGQAHGQGHAAAPVADTHHHSTTTTTSAPPPTKTIATEALTTTTETPARDPQAMSGPEERTTVSPHPMEGRDTTRLPPPTSAPAAGEARVRNWRQVGVNEGRGREGQSKSAAPALGKIGGRGTGHEVRKGGGYDEYEEYEEYEDSDNESEENQGQEKDSIDEWIGNGKKRSWWSKVVDVVAKYVRKLF